MTEDMFGGPHHEDEVKRTEHRVGARKTEPRPRKVLVAEIATALMQGCLDKNKKTYGFALDTADFVRHVSSVVNDVSRARQPSFSSCVLTY